MHRSLGKLLFASMLFFISISIGTIGFMIIEGYNTVDSVYMSVITFATVGFKEVQPLSETGKIFTSIYIILNLGIFAYTVSALSSVLFEGELQKVLKSYIESRGVKKLNNHIIVCGYGRNGSKACEELAVANKKFVVIDKDPAAIEQLSTAHKYQYIQADATMDHVLMSAGVERASAIITTLPSDADNVFITLTASEHNPNINIIAKATDTNSEKKLYHAGAHHVVMPGRLGGIHMANLVTKPYVIELLELLNGVGDTRLELVQIPHEELKPEFHNQSLQELDIRNKTGATIIAFKDKNAGFVFNPKSEKTIDKGDIMIVLGFPENLKLFKDYFTH